VTVTTDCGPNTTRTWPTAAKQSNDFGGTGNDFRALNAVSTGVKVGCPDHLAVTHQPTDTLAGQVIDAGTGVQTAIEDSAGQVVTISSATISVAIGANPSGGTLYGTSPGAASGRVATVGGRI